MLTPIGDWHFLIGTRDARGDGVQVQWTQGSTNYSPPCRCDINSGSKGFLLAIGSAMEIGTIFTDNRRSGLLDVFGVWKVLSVCLSVIRRGNSDLEELALDRWQHSKRLGLGKSLTIRRSALWEVLYGNHRILPGCIKTCMMISVFTTPAERQGFCLRPQILGCQHCSRTSKPPISIESM